MSACAVDQCGSAQTEKVWYCERCGCCFCDTHWKQQIPHDPRRSHNGALHVKVDLRLTEVLEPIFNTPNDPRERDRLLQQDSASIWFAFHRDEKSGTNYLQNYDTYATLMQDTLAYDVSVRHPQLVSFIGETGVGKSTLISMLINLHEVDVPVEAQSRNASPVVGSVNDNLPTTSSVHLYSDPETAATSKPLLFVDMEGLRGGESRTMTENHSTETASACAAGIKYEMKQRIRSSRPIRWATTPDLQRREYTVTSLYPRFLYTFSDVVVFVVQGFRSFQSVLILLLDWASKSLETSVNQPLMPHAIIASNFTDKTIDPNQWNVEAATEKLLRDFQSSVDQVPELRQRKKFWEDRGEARIRTVKDLILRYYSSISVIRMPHKESLSQVGEQVRKLRHEIQTKCDQSARNKIKLRSMLDSDTLQAYLLAGFDHFSTHLDRPFNFLDVAVRRNPISRDFSENMYQLAIDMAKKSRGNFVEDSPGIIFGQMRSIISSCIILDLNRKQRPGRLNEAFRKYYQGYCDQALNKFVTNFWPCSYEGCANVQSFHQKGHQNNSGKVIAVGDYQTNFDLNSHSDKWHKQLESSLHDRDREVRQMSVDDNSSHETHAFSGHTNVVREFYENIGGASLYASHSACLCCLLSALPEHTLPCGHVICSQCVSAHGQTDVRGTITLKNCPLHRQKADWVKPFVVHTKPPLAGVSVLSMDGGGARGIVMLETLDALRSELPSGIEPAQFFDLIVGTSTGGLIALGLGVKKWSLDQAIDYFTKFVRDAFTPRSLLIGPAALLFHGALYKTQPLIDALKASLGDANLFGGRNTEYESSTKVAVTATTATGQRPVILANYSRRQTNHFRPDYQLERPQSPDDELKLWQAGRATCAAPTIFKPYMHEKTNKGYLDGALYYKNPARVANLERMMIWPDTIDQSPDVFVSLGTGKDNNKRWVRPHQADGLSVTSIPQNPNLELFRFPNSNNQLGQRRRLPGLRNVVKEFMNNTMNSERMWNNFRSEMLSLPHHTDRRWFRVNPTFPDGQLPQMDNASQVSNLQFHTRRALDRERAKGKFREMARRLVASSFFFHKISTQTIRSGWQCKGKIYCKFPDRTEDVDSMAQWLFAHKKPDFTPSFEVYTDHRHGVIQTYVLEKKTLTVMARGKGPFGIEIDLELPEESTKTFIDLVLGENEKYPISGFPTILVPKAPESPLSASEGNTASRSSIETTSLSVATEPMVGTTRAAESFSQQPKQPKSRLMSFLFKPDESGKRDTSVPQNLGNLPSEAIEIFLGAFEQTRLIDAPAEQQMPPRFGGISALLQAQFAPSAMPRSNDSPFDSDEEPNQQEP